MQSISRPFKKHYTKIRNVKEEECEFQSLHWNMAGHLEKKIEIKDFQTKSMLL